MQKNLNLSDDDFSVFGLPRLFDLDVGALEERWKALLVQMHPDKFSTQGVAAQRLATQWSVRINEAYQTLKNPLKRAALLCDLAGKPIQPESNTVMPASFLMQQMEWREQLEEAQTVDGVEVLQGLLEQERSKTLASLSWLIDGQGNFDQAVGVVRVLMFMDRFKRDIDARLDELDV